MLSWRVRGALFAVAVLNLGVTTCRSPGEGGETAGAEQEREDAVRIVSLPGVDTSELTSREKRAWSRHVTELLAPCPDQPVTLEQCVREKRSCAACRPAAEFALRAVQRGMPPDQVEALVGARFAPEQVRDIELDGSPSKGARDAPVMIVEWADFECPACAAARLALDSVLERHPGKVGLVFKHFPLSMHPNAELAARAAVAAQRQDKFWPMHEGLFEAGAPLSRPALERIARSIGLDMNRFKADLDSEVVADAVLRDRKQGEAVELTGTPGIFVNGRRFVSGADFDADLAEWVKLELELATGGAAAPSASPPAPSKPSTSPPAPSKPSVAPAPSASAEGIAASPAAKPSPAPAKPAASAPR